MGERDGIMHRDAASSVDVPAENCGFFGARSDIIIIIIVINLKSPS